MNLHKVYKHRWGDYYLEVKYDQYLAFAIIAPVLAIICFSDIIIIIFSSGIIHHNRAEMRFNQQTKKEVKIFRSHFISDIRDGDLRAWKRFADFLE